MAEQPKVSTFDRWAIVVGISKYQDESLNLGYADRDARAFYELIRSPSGGDFKEDHIALLINAQATTRRITQALRSFLKRPAREDLVVIYIACHGCPDPERPNNVYLLTHDVDKHDIAGTGVPMDEIDSSLRGILHAEKVVIIADTCHSAAIGGGPGSRDLSFAADTVNNYLDAVSRAKGGTALITSCEANETAQEDVSWGGGHGVFTHFLLQGMRGAADSRPKNGQVTLGELFEYVRENVKEATGHRQHPSIGTTQFDRNLPMAVPGLERSRELAERAQAHFDAGNFSEAERLWSEAHELSPKNPDPTVGLGKIKALRERRTSDLLRRRKVLREYFQSKELSPSQFNEAMRLLDKKKSLSEEESSNRILLMALVDKEIDVSVYKASIEATVEPSKALEQPTAPVVPKENQQVKAEAKTEKRIDKASVQTDKPVSASTATAGITQISTANEVPKSRQSRPQQRSSRKWIAWASVVGLAAAGVLAWQFWPANAARIESFSASATTVESGDQVTLTWRTANAIIVQIDGMGTVSASGSRQVTPAASTTYRLVATGERGTDSANVSVAVTAPPQRRAGDTFSDCTGCPDMVLIPAGTFLMGSPESESGRFRHEGPVHRVTIAKPFAMGTTEVTFEEYDQFANATRRALPPDEGWDRGDRPVINVNWEDATAYAAWLSERTGKTYRLPSEAEWEYAARAGSQTAYWWGDAVGEGRANCDGCGSGWDNSRTAPVMSFSPNAFGLYDTAGNVWEWVQDCYWGSYEGAPVDGAAAKEEPFCDPRTIRGGAFYDRPVSRLRSANRAGSFPSNRKSGIGFRLARDL